jgi:hypothetical protein
MADELAKHDGNVSHTMLFVKSGEIKNVSDTNPIPVTSGSSNAKFFDQNSDSIDTSYINLAFGFDSVGIIVCNDDETNNMTISWNGSATAHVLYPGESITMNNCKHSSIYVKSGAAATNYRVTIW